MATSFRRNDFWNHLAGQAVLVLTIACPPKQSQKWLRRKLVPISLIVSEEGNWTECAAFRRVILRRV